MSYARASMKVGNADADDTRARRRAELRARCRLVLGHGYHRHSVTEELERVAEWCRREDVETDTYGTGTFLQRFEARVAALLGQEKARFMPSGTMAQAIAARWWCDRAGASEVGLHPTCHLELHEHHAYSHLHRLHGVLLGDPDRPPAAGDLDSLEQAPAVWIVELPTRENGGQLPSWDELCALQASARERGVKLHLDGARLWEAQAHYDRPLADICAGFDSVYVSFYKGIGALPGAMLLGDAELIEDAAIWQRRQGGNLFTSLPSAASAAMRLDGQLAKMADFRAQARAIGTQLEAIPGLAVLPQPPQVNMFHLRFAASPEVVLNARDEVAERTGLWLLERAAEDGAPDRARAEMVFGDAARGLSSDEVVQGFAQLADAIATAPA